MVTKKQKEKNILDLEYNHILNKQNILVILLGTAIISVAFIDSIPEEIRVSRLELIFLFAATIIGVLIYFSKKLEDKVEEIEKL